jgi:tripartite ATP-independent transporter DctM subunit
VSTDPNLQLGGHGNEFDDHQPTERASSPRMSSAGGGHLNRRRLWNRLVTVIVRVPDTCTALALFGLMAIVITNVITRSLLQFSLLWEDEVTTLLLAVLTFVGAAVAYRNGHLIAVNVMRERLAGHPRVAAWHEAATDCTVAAIATGLCWFGVDASLEARASSSPILHFSQAWYAVAFSVGMGLLAAYALVRLRQCAMSAIAIGIVFLGALAGLELVGKAVADSAGTGSAIWFGLATLAILLAAGIPIGVAMAGATIVFAKDAQISQLSSVSQAMLGETNSFILIAVPLFVFAGLILANGGLSGRLVHALYLYFRRLRGGIGHVVVVAMYVFSGVSGSKVADVAAVGSALSDEVDELGLEREDLAALLSASAVMGETVPPSVALLVAATSANVSVLAAFAGGLLPAAVIGIMLMISIAGMSRRKQRTIVAVPLRDKLAAGVSALPALAVGFILVYGLLTGIASPAEISGVACVVAILASFAMRGLNIRRLIALLWESSNVTGMVMFMISSAGGFAWALTIRGVPQTLASSLQHLDNRSWLFLLGSIVVLPIIGFFLEGLPAILVAVPLLTPVAEQMHVNLVFYVVLMTLALGLGTFLPPIGVGLAAAAGVCDVQISRVGRRLSQYLAVVFAGIIIIAFVPDIVLVVPRLLGLNVGT